ncbi:MAG: Mur ligase domain-containing protein [Comamonadaceae bacterium]|nr:Mur ligase domain-containing protein [Comamonadaceae bacterium]
MCAAYNFSAAFPVPVGDRASVHIHILGICGTFMGGLAQLARAAGHRVTGCDANVYPPMSDQLRAAGHRADRGLRRRASSALAPDLFVDRQRGHARQSADGGDPRRRRCLHLRPAVARRARAARPLGAGGGRHARQDDRPRRCWRGSSITPGSQPGFLIGGVPQDFGVSARRSGGAASS